eukprot:378720-Amphidinium_carterae.1
MVADNYEVLRLNQGSDYIEYNMDRTCRTTSFSTRRKLKMWMTLRDESKYFADEYFAEEAAKDDIENNEKYNVMGFDKLCHYFRQLLRLLLSIGRLCDDWRRRPIRGTLQFVQRHEQDL